jgi:hypothetical protein
MEVMLVSGFGSMSRAARMISGVMTLGRPPTRPRARAEARPSRVPETMSSPDELCQRGEDMEDEPAAWSGGVQVLVQRGEADLTSAQITDRGDQIL